MTFLIQKVYPSDFPLLGSADAIRVDVLQKAIADSVSGATLIETSARKGVVTFVFESEPGAEEKTHIDAACAAHGSELDPLREQKIEAIDARTRDLVLGGYSHNGRVFSSSQTAQRNLEVLDRNRNDLTYPFDMSTRDNTDVYAIADADEMHEMAQKVLSAIVGHYQQGNALKKLVINASTWEEIEAIVDPR